MSVCGRICYKLNNYSKSHPRAHGINTMADKHLEHGPDCNMGLECGTGLDRLNCYKVS